MLLGALFVLCIIGIILALIMLKDMRKSLIILLLCGFAIGFVTEYFGIHRELWQYTDTDTFFFFNIPFEVLVLYATALMFAGPFTLYLVKLNRVNDRTDLIAGIYFVIGIMFVIAFLFGLSPLVFPLGFFAMWGLTISKMKAVPLMLGLVTFAIDVLIEGSLAVFTNYYEWTLEIPFAFMFFAIAFGGYLTSGKGGE